MLEIRFHGRGGQGALIAARILATAFWKEKKYALVLPEFGSERRGAPTAVGLRVDEKPVVLRSKIYTPDYLIILDPCLLLKQAGILDGLKQGGFIIISAAKESQYLKMLHGFKVGIADVDAIARKYGLGHETFPATGTAILGVLVKITNLLSMGSVLDAIKEFDDLPKKENNALAVQDAFNEAQMIAVEGPEQNFAG